MSPEEAIAALKQMPENLRQQVAGLTDAQLHFQPEGGYFSVLENICHLRDIEIEGYGVRLQRMLAENHPTLPDINGGQLARERHYSEQPLQPALDAFIQARYSNLKILEKVAESRLARTAYLEDVGEITLSKLLELWVEHDRGHIHELDKLRAAVR
ncbi:MAG: DinB family protein [Gammaproteobacteria bacterium]|nr:DinB family protein [Gammaproteobacteria bacterium]